jgi:CHAD domain-containing protein
VSQVAPSAGPRQSSTVQLPAGPEPSAAAVIQDALRAQVRNLREQEPGARQASPEAVAEMRVTTRQLRCTLLGFSRTLDRSAIRPVAEELKWLGAQLADERDTHELVERLSDDVRLLPEDMVVGPVVADLREAVRRLDREGAQTITVALDSLRYQALLHALDQLTDDPPRVRRADRPAHTELPKSLAKALRALERRLVEADGLAPGRAHNVALHEARKADKRVRYMCELVIPVVGEPAHRLHRQAEKLQKLLGDHQDSVVARATLRQLAAEAHAKGHSAFTYGLLYALEHQRAEQVTRELPGRLAQLRDPRTISWLPQPS